MGPAVPLTHLPVDPVEHRPANGLLRLCCDQLGQPLVQHLGVPRLAERPPAPPELVAHRLGDLAVQERMEGGQRASEAAQCDPHLVHRVRHITADQRVQPAYLRHLP